MVVLHEVRCVLDSVKLLEIVKLGQLQYPVRMSSDGSAHLPTRLPQELLEARSHGTVHLLCSMVEVAKSLLEVKHVIP